MSQLVRWSLRLALPVSLALASCGGDDGAGGGSGGGGAGGNPIDNTYLTTTFAGYCTGKLLAARDLMPAESVGAWMGNGSQHAAAGTEFLVGVGFDNWEGFVVLSDGTPAKIDADFSTGLVKDTDFTSDCADDPTTAVDHKVLLADATFYGNEQLTGTPCTIAAGTELTQFSFMNSGQVATVSAEEIKAQCGLDTSWSGDIHYGSLIAR